jgi:hypothetical protein
MRMARRLVCPRGDRREARQTRMKASRRVVGERAGRSQYSWSCWQSPECALAPRLGTERWGSAAILVVFVVLAWAIVAPAVLAQGVPGPISTAAGFEANDGNLERGALGVTG